MRNSYIDDDGGDVDDRARARARSHTGRRDYKQQKLLVHKPRLRWLLTFDVAAV